MEAQIDQVFKNELKITDTTGNPGALGLLAFGLTTIILNLHMQVSLAWVQWSLP
jgi:hypothetical protein